MQQSQPPASRAHSFTCPHCDTYAAMDWASVRPEIELATCQHCDNFSIWVGAKMVYPDQIAVPPPNGDLADDVQADYLEAARILDRSPRGAVALLRLAIQLLCKQLGQPGKELSDDIATLLKDGRITKPVQQALDIVRVVGNNAVHPGQIDLRDDRDTALTLFELINVIADRAITQPMKIQKIYDSLPAGARDSIEKRDGTARQT
jgi:hypothetical protein